MTKICDAVFEGGGMRGIGFVGAAHKFEQMGYTFRRVAGSSAGAIVASLIAAGYTAEEMRIELSKVDFNKFKQTSHFHKLGLIGAAIGAAKNFGLYNAEAFENWLAGLLARKNVYTFSDVKGGLKLIASNVTDQKVLVLPNDLANFGIDPNTFSVAAAVRMSMSIPVFYEPYELIDKDGAVHYIVDGGLLSNYPIWIFDDGTKKLDVPVFGFRFRKSPGQIRTKKANLISYVRQIVATAIESGDDDIQTVMRGDPQRTVFIGIDVGSTKVGITDFHLPSDIVQGMYDNGVKAADHFLKNWDFKKWQHEYRYNPNSLYQRFKKFRGQGGLVP